MIKYTIPAMILLSATAALAEPPEQRHTLMKSLKPINDFAISVDYMDIHIDRVVVNNFFIGYKEEHKIGHGMIENIDESRIGPLQIGYDPRSFIGEGYVMKVSPTPNVSFGAAIDSDSTDRATVWVSAFYNTILSRFDLSLGQVKEVDHFAGARTPDSNTQSSYITAGFSTNLSSSLVLGLDATIAKAEVSDQSKTTLGSARGSLAYEHLYGTTIVSIGLPMAPLNSGFGFHDFSGNAFNIQQESKIDFGLSHKFVIDTVLEITLTAANRHSRDQNQGWFSMNFAVRG